MAKAPSCHSTTTSYRVTRHTRRGSSSVHAQAYSPLITTSTTLWCSSSQSPGRLHYWRLGWWRYTVGTDRSSDATADTGVPEGSAAKAGLDVLTPRDRYCDLDPRRRPVTITFWD